jgi:hypothetical protein
MTAIKITKFVGTAPRNSPELLSDTSAQVARNAKLYSGDLIPYPEPVVVGNTGRTGQIKTLYGIRGHEDTTLKFLSFTDKVSIVTPATDKLEEHRFYYTGDGKPKVSTYDLATAGSAGPYPLDYYELGLPLPEEQPTVVATDFDAATAIRFKRDNANTVTLTTADPHNLKSGAVASISGFTYRNGTYSRSGTTITVTIVAHGLTTGATVFLEFTSGGATTNSYSIIVTGADTFTCTDTVSGTITTSNVKWDIRDLNTITEVAVIDDTTITYFATGPAIAETEVRLSGTYTQSASATATITLTNHGLVTGNQVYLEFTSGDALDDNGTYAVTVSSPSVFTVVLPTSRTTSGTLSVYLAIGVVDLGDQIQGRSYLYTWFTPWREESIGSEPTEPIYIREGQIVTVTDLPEIPPAGKYNIQGVRLYRTIATITGADFFLIRTLWFPAAVSRISRTNGTVRVTMRNYHNLLVKDRIKLVCTTDPTFDATDVLVTRVVDQDTFEFEQTGDEFAEQDVEGTLYYDIAEKKTDDARYWGLDGVFTFVDDYNYRSLLTLLRTTEYEQPPEGLQGLTAMHNGIMVGFVGNDLYFSEPNQFHAWPSQYRKSFEYDIVALAAFGGFLLVLTKGYPYLVEGNTPQSMVPQKLSVMYPCVGACSVAQSNFGVVWATHDGLAVFGSTAASQLLTKAVHHSDTWNDDTNPDELVGVVFKENYIASTRTAALTLESVAGEDGTGLSFVDLDFNFCAAWYDNEENVLYTTNGVDGDIFQWDDRSQQSMTARWKSKVFVTPAPVNLGAARVVADYDGQSASPLWETIEDTWATSTQQWDGGATLTFNLYINKSLIFTTSRTDSGIFRLPAGYKSDTFEVEVIGPLRVRSIHLAETPLGLAGV